MGELKFKQHDRRDLAFGLLDAATTYATPQSWRKTAFTVALLCVAVAIASPAQTFTSLVSFDGTNGAGPDLMSLVQGTDGNFYGTTAGGGTGSCTGGCGTVFKITSGGTLTTLHSFAGYPTDGASPIGGLVLGTNGNFYGTTEQGGANQAGTVFTITSEGTLTTLYSFCSQSGCTDGAYPYATLVQATNGNFYGTTAFGGANDDGSVFSMTPRGTLTTLHSFDYTDGFFVVAGLVQATNGNFYGTTVEGGADGDGTIFSITSGGTLTTLHSFAGYPTDGATPYAGLVQATNGNFYGTTGQGGATAGGTIFSITAGGTLTTLYSFCPIPQNGCTDGTDPLAALVQATDGNFYGTTGAGGASNDGTVFSITQGGTLTTIHTFDGSDGAGPTGGLLQATNGTFYGAAYAGGAEGLGTVFSVSVGLGPFVSLLPNAGVVNNTIGILGQGFTGSTSVSFNGAAAKFDVFSDTYLTASVPIGATTGPVNVDTPSGTLTSNQPFQIMATITARP